MPDRTRVYTHISVSNLDAAIAKFVRNSLPALQAAVRIGRNELLYGLGFLEYRLDDGFKLRRTFSAYGLNGGQPVLVVEAEWYSLTQEEPVRTQLEQYEAKLATWLAANPSFDPHIAQVVMKTRDGASKTPLSRSEIDAIARGIESVVPIVDRWNSAQAPGGESGSWRVKVIT